MSYVTSVDNANISTAALSALSKELEVTREFQDVLKELEKAWGSEAQRKKEKAEAEKAAQEKKERQKKINDLRALIAQLRQRLISSGNDPAVAAQLASAESELFWLMFSLAP